MEQLNNSTDRNGIEVKTSFGSVLVSKEDVPTEGCDLAIMGQDGKYIVLRFDWERNDDKDDCIVWN